MFRTLLQISMKLSVTILNILLTRKYINLFYFLHSRKFYLFCIDLYTNICYHGAKKNQCSLY